MQKSRVTGVARLAARLATADAAERIAVLVGLAAFLTGTLPGLVPLYDRLLTVVCVAVALAFLAFYGLRLRASEERRRYAVSGAAIVDLLSAVPVPLALLFGMPPQTARLLGIFWTLKLIRFNPAFALLWRVLRSERQPLLSVTMAFVVVVLFAATIVFVVERDAQPEAFGSVPAALWWAVTTITTTGYGDKIPATFVGRLLASGLMVAGIGLFALWAGILASGFAQELRRREFLESWDLVVRLPLFRGLGAGALAEVSRLLKVQTYSPEAAIVRQGQPGDSMFFVAEGEVEVRAGPVRIRLGPGQFFGEGALITGEPRNASIFAVTPARLLRLDVIEFRGLAERQPELLEIISSENAKRKLVPG